MRTWAIDWERRISALFLSLRFRPTSIGPPRFLYSFRVVLNSHLKDKEAQRYVLKSFVQQWFRQAGLCEVGVVFLVCHQHGISFFVVYASTGDADAANECIFVQQPRRIATGFPPTGSYRELSRPGTRSINILPGRQKGD